MGFRLMMLSGGEHEPFYVPTWPERLREAVPDIQIDICDSIDEAKKHIPEADAGFGNIVPELFELGRNLRWIMSPWAGPKAGYYHQALIDSDVVVTNVRGIFGDYISAHIMSFVLSFARRLDEYIPQQSQRTWRPLGNGVFLPEATVVIVGVGGIGAETARLCAEFGMTVLGVDGRVEEAPKGVAELHPAEALAAVLPRGDFVIVTVPETPETQGLFSTELFMVMKPTAFFINIGRGATVVLDDLTAALEAGSIAGAALDVFQVEPLPRDHPLWTTPRVIITPHVAAGGGDALLDERRMEIFIENCVRFNEGRPLRNVVDKSHWF